MKFIPWNEDLYTATSSAFELGSSSNTIVDIYSHVGDYIHAGKYELVNILVALVIGIIIGIMFTMLWQARKQTNKHNAIADNLIVESDERCQQSANSINNIVRNLINTQYATKSNNHKMDSIYRHLSKSIQQLRGISLYLHSKQDPHASNIFNDPEFDEPNKQTLEQKPIGLSLCGIKQIIDEQLSLAQVYLDDITIDFECEFEVEDKQEQFVCLPADWLRKAMREIIMNAVKHNKKKQSLRIDVRLAKDEDSVALDICDNGQGIPSQLTADINTLTSNSKALLGLTNPILHPTDLKAIQAYLQQQNGELVVTSARNFVTKVSMKFSLTASAQCQAAIDDVAEDNDNNSDSSLHQHIRNSSLVSNMLPVIHSQNYRYPNLLITNLDQVPVSNARTTLYQYFNIFDATSLPDAIALIEHEKIDCLIVDVGLAGAYTIDTLNFLRKHHKCKHLPTVIIGSEIDKTKQLQMLNLGLFALLVHPVQGEQVSAVIKGLLAKRNGATNNVEELVADYSSETVQECESEQTTSFATKFQSVLHKHFADENFNRQQAATEMAMHERTLHRKLAEEYDLNFTEILKDYRLKAAKRMIENGVTVTSAAYNSGFNSPSYFAQCFKTEFGMSPSSVGKQA